MSHTRVIGISGVSGCGKDTFCELLRLQNPKIQRFALADELKKELYPTYLDFYGVDIFNCIREVKDHMRPLLVAHGKIRRNLTVGTYWTQKLEPQILDYLAKDPENIACVTDIRYDVFKEDELFWLKSHMRGSLVHIQLSETANGRSMVVPPINIDEAENDPRLCRAADFRIDWEKNCGANGVADYSKLSIYAEKYLDYANR